MNFINHKPSPLLITIILAVVLGFAAGLVGASLRRVEPDFIFDNQLNSGNIQELIRLSRYSGLKNDLQAELVAELVRPKIAALYAKKAQSSDPVGSLYDEKNLLGFGIILTNDGWILTSADALKVSRDKIVVEINNQFYQIQQQINDTVAKTVFLKIDALNLPVAKLGVASDIQLAQTVLILNLPQEILLNQIKSLNNKNQTSAVISTETYSDYLAFNLPLENAYPGAPVVNLSGEIIGIVSNNLAVPVNYFRPVIESVLKNGFVNRPALGVNYLDLSSAPGLSPDYSHGLERGALVVSQPKQNTAAAASGLKKDDIILKVDGQNVSSREPLTNLIQSYQAGELIYLTVNRAGLEITIEVYLGAIE